jgi:pyrimidine operon attenuation protein / uracil phosphoribosyltransferase
MSSLLFDAPHIDIILNRLAYELIENHGDFSKSALIGLQPKGVFLARRLMNKLKEITGNHEIRFGELDHTFHRDDFRRNDEVLVPNPIRIDFLVEDLNVVLVDDVLFTGRSVRSAMDALTDFGRPRKVELLVLIDRRYSRELPIEPTYVGQKIDTRSSEKVRVEWKENSGEDKVWMIQSN